MAGVTKNLLLGAGFKRWAYNLSGFNKYGLKYDDCLYETPEVKEALRRIPQKLLDERNFRIIRAMQLNCNKTILPEEQWTKFEEDVQYLRPYVEEVEREIREKEEWDKQ